MRRIAECGLSIAEWRVKRQGEKNCGLRSVDCGVGSEEAVKGIADCGVGEDGN